MVGATKKKEEGEEEEEEEDEEEEEEEDKAEEEEEEEEEALVMAIIKLYHAHWISHVLSSQTQTRSPVSLALFQELFVPGTRDQKCYIWHPSALSSIGTLAVDALLVT